MKKNQVAGREPGQALPSARYATVPICSDILVVSDSDSGAADVWGRAQSFVALYSAMQLHIVTDYVIETDNPRKDDLSFAYLVVRTPLNRSFQITVVCRTSGGLNSEADMNAHILAYYIKTGELPYPNLIKR